VTQAPEQPLPFLKGRGSQEAVAHRFEKWSREAVDDGWMAQDGEGAVDLQTEVRFETARSALTRNTSPDIAFDLSLNPYRGCEHGCSYCYARPSHSYLNLSPGLDFEQKLIAKVNLPQVLRQELSNPRYQPQALAIGTVTDAYQPIERKLGLTRQTMAVLAEFRHPFSLVTKGSVIERDVDFLASLARQGGAAVYVTLTTLDSKLARRMEPRAASPLRRLRLIQQLSQAGIPVGVSLAPQIPFLNDDMEACLEAAKTAGAQRAFYAILRLPWELGPLFRDWLTQHYPQRAERVMARVQDMRGGKDYDASWGQRQRGTGLWSQLLAQRFDKACHRLGLHRERFPLDFSGFRRPSAQGQQSLFSDDKF
jgi:DNA repair photolyase